MLHDIVLRKKTGPVKSLKQKGFCKGFFDRNSPLFGRKIT